MKTLLLLLGLVLSWENGQVLGAKDIQDKELQEMSTQGSKYINKEIKNALKGVKQIKTLIDQTNEERKSLLVSLEEVKKKKEGALNDTKESELKLKESQGVCNETMAALWEECKPCLKQTCMKFYARVCRSGSGLVGRQLEEFLNQSSPVYLWVNGDRIDSLLENDRQQTHVLGTMQDSFDRASSIMDELFQDRFHGRGLQDPRLFFPFASPPRRSFSFSPRSRFARDIVPFRAFQPLHFEDMFQPFFEMIRQAQQAMEAHLHSVPYQFPMAELEDTPGHADDRTVCKEIRHNSTGCLRMKDQCDKCQEILAVDCSAENPEQALLRQELNASLQLAERFSQLYDELLRSYQQKMLNTSSLLKRLNQQFSWVSRLANLTQGEDLDYLQVTTVNSHSSDADIPTGITKVVVKLFDSPPIMVTVPEEVSRNDPKFMETVAEKALHEYRRNNWEE
ncbi:PREDICTED: clusterin [Condylura cristata]|uniref:clusterin n=1 Tax=Condylura cristata TaxID=143302 RepID=UPI0003345C31|nr:PREDICTED: clusterin [Condylura cristata]XP_012580400.1 PREDICTED: clusterin [Condylura cristata]